MTRKLTLEEFIERSEVVHGKRYQYPLQEYVGNKHRVRVVCAEHGEFMQRPNDHLRGAGCPSCGRQDSAQKRRREADELLATLTKAHPNYVFSSVQGVTDKISVRCPEHGEFLASPHHMLKGRGCPECGKIKAAQSRRISMSEFIHRARQQHADRYDYSKSEMSGGFLEPTTIICREHGEFSQRPQSHVQGQGCPECASEERAARNRDGAISFSEFVSRARAIHGTTYDYIERNYAGTSSKVSVVCSQHGEFQQLGSDHLNGSRCPVCAHTVSSGQVELLEFVRGFFTDAVPNYRYGVGKKEVDVFIPSLNLAIEYDGIYYHSTAFRRPAYHVKKRSELWKMGIGLIRIFEDEWKLKRGIVERLLTHRFGRLTGSVYARSCEIRTLDFDEARSFHNANHIQGYKGAGVSLGLFHAGSAVAVMTFSRVLARRGTRGDAGLWELVRFSTSTSVPGAASRLFKRLCATTEASSVVSYSDNRLFSGDLYRVIGFDMVGTSRPSYTYVGRGKTLREHKRAFSRENLAIRFAEGFDPTVSEKINCERAGYFRLYDCGLTKWMFTNLPFS